MPSKVKILIRRAKNLPIMDRKTKLTDAYVEVRLGTGYFGKTPLQPHTLNPVWKKVITFQVSEDKTLVTDPLEIKVFDKDVVSDNIIGIVYLDLSTLLYPCPAPSFVPTGLASPRLAAPFRTTPDKRVSRDIPVQPGSGGSSSSGGSLAGSTPIGIAVPTVSVTGGGGGGGSSGSNSRRGGIFTPPTKLASALFRGTAARRGGDASSGATSGEDASGCCSDAEDGEAGSGAYTQNGNNNNNNNGDNINNNNNNNNNDGTKISGWFPIYDTLKGVQGEISITAEVRKIENKDPLAELSVGVMFFSTSTPPGIERVVGLVGACKIADDPEYQWADTFRLSRTSNEVRQVLMYKLAGRLRKKLSVQAHNLGCNAVIGYRQCIELEGTMGLVARGYGTAAVVVPYAELRDSDSASALDPADAFHSPITFPASLPAATTATTATAWSTGSGSVPAPQTLSSSLKSGNGFPLSVSQSQVQQQGSQTSQQQQQQQQQQQPQLSKSQQQQAMIQNIPLLSVTALEPGAIQHVGGVVIVNGICTRMYVIYYLFCLVENGEVNEEDRLCKQQDPLKMVG